VNFAAIMSLAESWWQRNAIIARSSVIRGDLLGLKHESVQVSK
jgi:hypothetical protein